MSRNEWFLAFWPVPVLTRSDGTAFERRMRNEACSDPVFFEHLATKIQLLRCSKITKSPSLTP